MRNSHTHETPIQEPTRESRRLRRTKESFRSAGLSATAAIAGIAVAQAIMDKDLPSAVEAGMVTAATIKGARDGYNKAEQQIFYDETRAKVEQRDVARQQAIDDSVAAYYAKYYPEQ